MPLRYVTLPVGTCLYARRFAEAAYTPPLWFAPTRDYGSSASYGPLMVVHKVRAPLRLLDLGDAATRAALRRSDELLHSLLDPDMQYGGGKGNRAAHERLQTRLKGLHGTIIISEPLPDPFAAASKPDEETEGASEIVLFKAGLASVATRDGPRLMSLSDALAGT